MTTGGLPSRAAPKTNRLARTLRHRDMVAGFLTAAPPTLACGTMLWAGAVALGRWTDRPMPIWELAGLVGALSLTAAAYFGWSRARSALTLLFHADTVLKQPSVLTNTWQLAADPSPFSQSAVRSGEEVAEGINAPTRARLVPLWRHAAWRSVLSVGPLLVSLALAGWVWRTEIRPWGSDSLASTLTVEAAQQIVAQASEAIAPPTPGNDATAEREDPIAARAQAELDALEKELRSGAIKPDDAATRAARTLESAAEAMDAQAKTQQFQADRTAEAIAQAAAPVANAQNGESADELTKALAQAELAKAAARAEDIARQPGQLSESDRKALAEELQAMADAMAKVPQHSPSDQQTPGDRAPDASVGAQAERGQDAGAAHDSASKRDAGESSGKELADALRKAAAELQRPASEGTSQSTQQGSEPQKPGDSARQSTRDNKGADRNPDQKLTTPDKNTIQQGKADSTPDARASENASEKGNTSDSKPRDNQNDQSPSSQDGVKQAKDGKEGAASATRNDGSESRKDGQSTQQKSPTSGSTPSEPARPTTPNSTSQPKGTQERTGESRSDPTAQQGEPQPNSTQRDSATPNNGQQKSTDNAATAKGSESQPSASRQPSSPNQNSQERSSGNSQGSPQSTPPVSPQTQGGDQTPSQPSTQQDAAPKPNTPSTTGLSTSSQPQSSSADSKTQPAQPTAQNTPQSQQTGTPRGGRAPDSPATQPNPQRENNSAPQSESSAPLGPPTSRPSDQTTEPRDSSQTTTEPPNALSELAQKFRSIDRARQGQPQDNNTPQQQTPQDLRKKAQELLAQADARNSGGGRDTSPPGPSPSQGDGPPPTSMKTQATGPSGQSGDSSAGSGDPTRDGNSTSRSTQRGTGATQSIDFNPTTASTPASTSTDRVIAELPSQPTSASAQRAATASGQASIEESLRTARKQADRAIESQTIPREYQDLVRRVFRRYDSRTPAAPSIAPGSTEPGTTNLSPDAAPAKSPPSKPALPPK